MDFILENNSSITVTRDIQSLTQSRLGPCYSQPSFVRYHTPVYIGSRSLNSIPSNPLIFYFISSLSLKMALVTDYRDVVVLDTDPLLRGQASITHLWGWCLLKVVITCPLYTLAFTEGQGCCCICWFIVYREIKEVDPTDRPFQLHCASMGLTRPLLAPHLHFFLPNLASWHCQWWWWWLS